MTLVMLLGWLLSEQDDSSLFPALPKKNSLIGGWDNTENLLEKDYLVSAHLARDNPYCATLSNYLAKVSMVWDNKTLDALRTY